ncbi:MAG: hypothetical protein K1X86_05075 [Ignavibacteria bacterium]|nr:hypothetical protein [Ignavibacteria bacterium]
MKDPYNQYLFLDTNILSHIAKDESKNYLLSKYCFDNKISLAITPNHLGELSDATRLHENLSKLLISVPSVLLKNFDIITQYEVDSYPQYFKENLTSFVFNSLLLEADALDKISSIFSKEEIKNVREEQKINSQNMFERLVLLKNNFPTNKMGAYDLTQLETFEFCLTVQWLTKNHLKFLEKFKNDVTLFNYKIFKGIRIYSIFLFYKYYIGKRLPKNSSDFGDFSHIQYFPYCKIVITEKDNWSILNEIKKHSDILDSVQIHNIDYLKNIFQ